MKRKLVKVGNSLAVTLPSELVKELKLKPGAEVDLNVDPKAGSVSVRFGPRDFAGGKVTKEFLGIVDDVLDQYDEAWRRLA